jgi:large subunit ribosomal protein L25
MLSLSAKIRKELGKKVKTLRKKGILPGVLYGPKLKEAQPLEIDLKEFEKVYQEAGESSLISLEVEGKRFPVLIHKIQLAPLTGKPTHVDFYQPALEEEVTVEVPLVFEGEASAVKDLGGTLVKNISELKIKAKPQDLPHEIKVNIESLKTFEDNIKISNLKVPEGVRILKGPEEFVASVSPPEKVEEELVKPIEEKVEEVEKVEEKKEEKKVEAEEEK